MKTNLNAKVQSESESQGSDRSSKDIQQAESKALLRKPQVSPELATENQPFDEVEEGMFLERQLRKKFDIEQAINKNFNQMYKTKFQAKLDNFVKEGFNQATEEMFTSTIHKKQDKMKKLRFADEEDQPEKEEEKQPKIPKCDVQSPKTTKNVSFVTNDTQPRQPILTYNKKLPKKIIMMADDVIEENEDEDSLPGSQVSIKDEQIKNIQVSDSDSNSYSEPKTASLSESLMSLEEVD